RSTTSASAPAGRASRKTGRLAAVWSSATMRLEASSEVISHAAPTSCIHVPVVETTDATHSPRNTGLRSGLHADAAKGRAPPAGRSSGRDTSVAMPTPFRLLHRELRRNPRDVPALGTGDGQLAGGRLPHA